MRAVDAHHVGASARDLQQETGILRRLARERDENAPRSRFARHAKQRFGVGPQMRLTIKEIVG